MESNRALLDQLMGEGRNLQSDAYRRRTFSDPDVDKMYLCGCSPYELFKNTKSDLGPNVKIPDDRLKEEWDALPQYKKDRYGYEHDTHMFLEDLVRKQDRLVERNTRRVIDEEQEQLNEFAEKIVLLEIQISKNLKEIDSLACKGKVEQAYELFKQVNENVKEVEKLKSDAIVVPDKRHIICPVSGNLLSSIDNDDRLRAHFEGKQFTGWKKVREYVEKYRKNPPPPAPKSRRRSRSPSRSNNRSNSYSRSARREREDSNRGFGLSRSREHRNERGTEKWERNTRRWQ